MFKLLAVTAAVPILAGGVGATAAMSVLHATHPTVRDVLATSSEPSHDDPSASALQPDLDPHVPEIAPSPSVSLRPVVEVVGTQHAKAETVGDALERFRAAGLRLPDLVVVFHADDEPCKGHDGLFQPQFSPWRVLVCSQADYVLTHELAHAWEAANLDDDDRARYVRHRGLTAWLGTDLEWSERGVEDAAFMLQQNLMMRPLRVDNDRWAERLDAYRMLTGMASPIVTDRDETMSR